MVAEMQSFMWKFLTVCDIGYSANLSFDCYNGKISATLKTELSALSEEPLLRKFQKPSKIRRRKRRQAIRAAEASRIVTEDLPFTPPSSKPTSQTNNISCEEPPLSNISSGSLPAFHMNSDFYALDTNTPMVITDANVSVVEKVTLTGDEPLASIEPSTDLPVIDVLPSEGQLSSKSVNTLNMDEFKRYMEDFKSSFIHRVLPLATLEVIEGKQMKIKKIVL